MIESELPCTIRYAEGMVQDLPALLGALREASRRTGSRIVCFDADKLAGRVHAKAALRHAHRSFSSGDAISNSFEMEALLYAAGTRQCSAAVSFGLHEGENRLYICCCPAPQGIWSALACHLQFCEEPKEGITAAKAARLMSLFGITREELAAAGKDRLRDLVLERVALLDVSK